MRSHRKAGPGRVVALAVAAVLGLGGLAGCGGGEGTSTSCTLNACTVTFDRGVDTSVSVLGIDARLVDVQGDQVVLDVEGTSVTVPADGSAEVEGFRVEVQDVTAEQVVVRVARA